MVVSSHVLLRLLLILALPLMAVGMVRVETGGGATMTGEILAEKEDRVVLDLGFEVISIPREVIVRIVEEETEEPVLRSSGDLYRVAEGAQTLPLRTLVDRLGPAVVMVRTPTGLGSGFFINPEGYVVTNDHVIAGEHEITITVFEQSGSGLRKETFENVAIVASSPEMDIALLSVAGEPGRVFETVPLGDSADLRAGQSVFAIGSPLGLERSVSEGIISIANRPINGRLHIQTTTQISPGNSGGPLFNLQGEVVGVNNMKVVAMGAEGLGFAIPANVLKFFLKNRDAFAFDPTNPNAGFRYPSPPSASDESPEEEGS
ncbi:S1C family serine protease [Puniceicoccus vermicola]|uniref:Trypsin-like peptidase domain-containing protein n=1 Tax=Puniceicoccus vermicola TaxID=388746 RepID=A0A7X1E3L1_9BACT|nr:trypsin-like peptidase domain-containing protein [Puniceicoccus vermicola]MBC2601176.1 trypsin-like peptidase domain-containing protein [Puniceicoccus vermicola]